MIKSVLNKVEQGGHAVRIVSIKHAQDLKKTLETHYGEGMYDEELYRKYLSTFVYEAPAELPDARSIIVMATKQPQVCFTFTWNGKAVPVLVPPTYLHATETDRKAENGLSEALSGEGYRVVPARVPKKLLAAHSGLATYGRNNITYVTGMGSFHRINAFYSDLPCEDDVWQELRMKEACSDCGACMRACPAGAISPERFLLHAEKCIVFHNEKDFDIPFPACMKDSWHNCLVGCMLCQRVCPENRESLAWVEEGAAFSEEETSLILAGTPKDQMADSLIQKLQKYDLLELMEVIPRNLRVLLNRSK